MVDHKKKSATVINLREVTLDRVFNALSDATRRRLVRVLVERECSVSELAEPFDMSLAAVSKHLAVLEHAGLVRRRKDGRTRYCSLRPEALTGVADWIAIYRQYWRQRFDALAEELAKPASREHKR